MKTCSGSSLYRGRDWVTSRLSIAEALDALDHIHDLCLYGQDQGPEARAERFALIGAVHGLAEKIIAQCSIAQADAIPATSSIGSSALLLSCFETNQSLKALKERLAELTEESSRELLGELSFLALDLKTRLRRLDQ